MMFTGAVEATKALRARNKPIDERTTIAQQLLDDSLGVRLPRRELVILEWVFDMLTTDTAAPQSVSLWNLLAKVWCRSDDNGRQRVFRNHRFIVDLTATFRGATSSELIFAVIEALRSICSSLDIAVFATDAQVAHMVLAFLNNDVASANEDVARLVFQAARSRSNLFGSKPEPNTIDALLRETDQNRRLHYLRDFCRGEANSPVATSDKHVEDVMQAVCDSGVNIQPRFHELTAAFPQHSGRLIEVLVSLKPREASPDLLEKLVTHALNTVQGGPDWTVMELCLHIDAVPVLKHMRTLIEAQPTDHVVALLITRSAALRSLPEFLKLWRPQSRPSDIVVSSLTRAIESLPAVQAATLLSPECPFLELLVTSLTYKAAGSPPVKAALQKLLNEDIDLLTKIAVLELAPDLQIQEHKNSKEVLISLRLSEIRVQSPELKSLIKRLDEKDAADVACRFYPLIERYAESAKVLTKLMDKCGPASRLQLVRTDEIYEYPRFTEALIEKLIDEREFVALTYVPKQVFAWNQRHRIVDAALKHGDVSSAELVHSLIDSANPPEPQDLARFLRKFNATDVQNFMNVLKPIQRHRGYVDRLLNDNAFREWQTYCLNAVANLKQSETLQWIQEEYHNRELRAAVLTILSLLPPVSEVFEIVEKLAVELSADPPQLLFELVCRRKYHWSIVTALFVSSGCRFASPYIAYCRALEERQRDSLIMEVVNENLHGVLCCLASARLLHGQKHANAFTVLIARCHFGDVAVTSDLVKLCDAALREQLDLISGFALDLVIGLIANMSQTNVAWEDLNILLSHILLFKRRQLRGRMHLVISAMTSLLERVDNVGRAVAYVRLVENLCSPPQHYLGGSMSKEDLNSAVARDRRNVAKNLGVLLQNYVSLTLLAQRSGTTGTDTNTALRPAAFAMMDVLGGEGVRSVAASVDTASRTYLRTVYEDYTQNARWTSD